MSHQEFKSAKGEDVTFTVGDDPFVFKSLPKPPGGALLAVAMAAGASDDDDKAGMEVMRSTMDFLDACLDTESREHFASRFATTASAEGLEPISLDQATEVVRWLIGVHSGRPTVEPSPSAAGQSPSGTSSTASSSSTT